MNDILIAVVTAAGLVLVALINQGYIAKRSRKRVDETTDAMDEMLDRMRDLRADKEELRRDKADLQREKEDLERRLERCLRKAGP